MHLGTPIAGALGSKSFSYPRILFAGPSDALFKECEFLYLQAAGLLSGSTNSGVAGFVVENISHPVYASYNGARNGSAHSAPEPTIVQAVTNLTPELRDGIRKTPEGKYLAVAAAVVNGVSHDEVVYGTGIERGYEALFDFFASDHVRISVEDATSEADEWYGIGRASEE
jgi:hypothetical protein